MNQLVDPTSRSAVQGLAGRGQQLTSSYAASAAAAGVPDSPKTSGSKASSAAFWSTARIISSQRQQAPIDQAKVSSARPIGLPRNFDGRVEALVPIEM